MRAQGAFHEDSADFDFAGSEECRRSVERAAFRRVIEALEQAWPVEQRHNPYYPLVTWTDAGPRLGAATLLARRGEAKDAQMLALISIACGKPISSGALGYLHRAELEFRRGRYARSALQVALSGIPPLRGQEAARRLYFAAGILDNGFSSPARLMTMCGLDSDSVESIG